MPDCRTIRQEPKSVISASVVNHREGRRRFRIVPGALIYEGRLGPSTHRIKKSDTLTTIRRKPAAPRGFSAAHQAFDASIRLLANMRAGIG